jgi:RNA polymerase sigma factor (sigma-70 family)
MSSQAEPLLQHVRSLAGALVPDEQLLADYLARRDETAFAALVGRHGPMVLELSGRILRDRHAAEDVFQATFLLLAQRGEAIRRRASLASWLHGVAYRLAVRAKRRTASRPTGDLAACPAAAPTPSDALAWQEVLTVLDEELRKLPDRCRAPLVLCYLQARTQDEAARQLNLSVGTLRRRLEQGRALLEARLRNRGISLPAALAGLLAAGTAAVPDSLCAATVALAGRGVAGTAATVVAKQGGQAMIVRAVKVLAVLAVCGVGLGAGLWIHGRGAGERAAEVPLQAAAPAIETPSATVRLAAEAVESYGAGPHSFMMLLELGVQEAKQGNGAAARKRFQQAVDRLAGKDEYTRGVTLVLVAYRLAEAGDRNTAESLLVEARRLAQAVKRPSDRAEVLRFSTVCLAEKIDRGKALTWAAKIPDENCRLNAYRDIAVAQAAAGDRAGAHRTVELIRTRYGYFKLQPWKAIAAAELKAGDRTSAQATLRKALDAVEQMRKESWGDSRYSQIDVLLAFAVAQAQAGDHAGARATFGRVG